MQTLLKKLTKNEFDEYCRTKDFGSLPPGEIVLHHTFRPTAETWRGLPTLKILQKYYEGLGWSAGPHIFVAEDGIWLFSDMRNVGIHAGLGNATWLKNRRKIGGYFVRNAKLLKYSVGVEVVGNFDEKVWEGKTLKNAISCICSLKKRLGLSNKNIRFHREFSPKTCPGNAITKKWLFGEIEAYEAKKPLPRQKYEFKFSKSEALRAKKLGFLKQIDSENREIIAIGLTRVYERIKLEFREGRL